MTAQTSTRLSELVRLALPAGARLENAAASEDRRVAWIARLNLPLAGAPPVEPDDLVLLAGDFSLPSLIETLDALSQIGVAAVGWRGDPGPEAREAARRLGLPIVSLPESVRLRDCQRAALTLLMDRHAQIAARGAEVYQRLAQASAENAGLEMMTGMLSEVTGRGVLVQDKRLRPIAASRPAWLADVWPEVVEHLSNPDQLPDRMRDRHEAGRRRASELQALPGGLARRIAPIVVGGVARGYLSLLGPAEELDSLDTLVADHGAAACGLEMAKIKAVSETEKRFRGSFIEAVLMGALPEREIVQWAERAGYDIARPHAAIVMMWASEPHPSMRRLETLVNGEIAHAGLAALTRVLDDEVTIFCAEDRQDSARGASTGRRAEPGEPSARGLADAICRRAADEFPNARLACGVGRAAAPVDAWRTSYREATQALAMARRLNESAPLFFGDLSVYRLLFKVESEAELAGFCQEVLGRLAAYDEAHDGTLLETLAAYFANNGNLSKTAQALFIRRNSLLYRMKRIEEIGGLDLNNAETRLATQLALKARRLLS